jgi:phospholipase C
VITYDEHGGFYDHVPPPKAADDRPAMRRYGPRVPALVISPFVGRQAVSKTVFDHTSITKTILARFAAKPGDAIKKMGARVSAAKHLGELLTEDNPRPAPTRADYQTLLDHAAGWHEQIVSNGVREQMGGLAVPHELSDWQEDFLGAKQELLAARRQLARAGKDVF